MLAFFLLSVINFLIFLRTGNTPVKAAVTGGDWTVYGTMGCGWTRKQLEYLEEAGIPHTFVDCDKDGACSDMDAYPTMICVSGEKVVGFKKV